MSLFIEHESAEVMIQRLAALVIEALDKAVADRGQAVLAVSGGSTPGPLHEKLSQAPLPWDKITITLIDDRWVEPGESGSNETFAKETLLINKAARAHFVGLKTPGETPADGLAAAVARMADLSWPLDVALLGMGPDGHTASWFPHADGLDKALAKTGPKLAAVKAIKSEVTGDLVDRITMTRAAIIDARLSFLVMRGEAKKSVWHAANGEGPVEDFPIRGLLHDPDSRLITHWSP